MKDKIVFIVITFIGFMLIFIISEKFFLGGSGRLVPSSDRVKTWTEIFSGLGGYAIFSGIITVAIFMVNAWRERKKE